MAVYPLIAGPCPYQDRLPEIMDGDMCGMCERQVHDLTDMSDRARRAFLKTCSGEVCVSYKVSAGVAAALAALAAVVAAGSTASAQTPQMATAKPEDDVVVITGGRIAQSSQDIPIAVIAMDAFGNTTATLPAKSKPADPAPVAKPASNANKPPK